MKKKNNKGFTLVELIVVLVILAILAAILVPALLGYIDRAKEQQIVLNARSVYTAAQAEFSDAYAAAKSGKTISDAFGTGSTRPDRILTTADVKNVAKVVSVAPKAAPATATKANHDAWTVGYVKYQEGDDTIYFDIAAGEWTGEDPEPNFPTGVSWIEIKK